MKEKTVKTIENVIFTETWKKGIVAGRKIASLFDLEKEEVPSILKEELIKFLCLPKNNFVPENLQKFLKLIPGEATSVFTTAFENAILNCLEKRAEVLLSFDILSKEEQVLIAEEALGKLLEKEEAIAPDLAFAYGFLSAEKRSVYAGSCIVKSWKKGEILLKKIDCFLKEVPAPELEKAVRDLIVFYAELENYEKIDMILKTNLAGKETLISPEITGVFTNCIIKRLHGNQVEKVSDIIDYGFLTKEQLCNEKINEASERLLLASLLQTPPLVNNFRQTQKLGVVSQKVLSSEMMSHHTLIAVKDMLKNYDPTTVSSRLIKPLKNLGVNIEEEAIFADPENISIIKKRLLEKISNGTFGHALDEINATKLPKEDFNEIIRAGIDNRMSNGNLHFVKSLLEKGFLPKAENSLRYIKYRKAVKKGFVACFKNSYFNIVEEIVEMNIFDETELYDHVILGLKEAFNNCNPTSFQKVEVLLIKVKKHLPKEMGEKIDNLPIFKKIAENREADIIKQQALQRANKHY